MAKVIVEKMKGINEEIDLIKEGIQLWNGRVEPDTYIPSEKEITAQIRQWLKLRGIFHWKIWGNPMMMTGLADIIGILPNGRFLAIEVKKPRVRGAGGIQIRPQQKKFLLNIKANGGVAILAFCLEDVIRVLEPILARCNNGST